MIVISNVTFTSSLIKVKMFTLLIPYRRENQLVRILVYNKYICFLQLYLLFSLHVGLGGLHTVCICEYLSHSKAWHIPAVHSIKKRICLWKLTQVSCIDVANERLEFYRCCFLCKVNCMVLSNHSSCHCHDSHAKLLVFKMYYISLDAYFSYIDEWFHIMTLPFSTVSSQALIILDGKLRL